MNIRNINTQFPFVFVVTVFCLVVRVSNYEVILLFVSLSELIFAAEQTEGLFVRLWRKVQSSAAHQVNKKTKTHNRVS